MTDESAIDALAVDEKTAAKLLGLSIRMLFKLRQEQGLPFVRLGSAIRYRPEALARFLHEREQSTVTLST